MMAKLNRREFIGASFSTAVALALPQSLGQALAKEDERSIVIEVRSSNWRTKAGQIKGRVVRRMVNQGIMQLAAKSTPEAAWKSLFSPTEVVGLKFNRISRDYTGANQALVDAISSGLMSAGVKKKNIIVVEAHGARFEGGKPRKGWAAKYDFGSGKTRLSNLLVNQLDAVINVPNPKHHPITDFTGALKNISHANGTIMEGPNRFHGNNCDPYIADINALHVVREKMRIHLCNGLRGIFDRGAYPSPDNQWIHNRLYVSFDPVALDTICAQAVNKARAKRRRPPLRRHRYINTAADRGLGTKDPDLVDLISLAV